MAVAMQVLVKGGDSFKSHYKAGDAITSLLEFKKVIVIVIVIAFVKCNCNCN